MPDPSHIPPIIHDSISNATSHISKAILWLHNDYMYKAFLLGARIIKPRKVVYYNDEIYAMFQLIEQEQERKREQERELKQKKKNMKHKRRSKKK
jgi:hypothetical protein